MTSMNMSTTTFVMSTIGRLSGLLSSNGTWNHYGLWPIVNVCYLLKLKLTFITIHWIRRWRPTTTSELICVKLLVFRVAVSLNMSTFTFVTSTLWPTFNFISVWLFHNLHWISSFFSTMVRSTLFLVGPSFVIDIYKHSKYRMSYFYIVNTNIWYCR